MNYRNYCYLPMSHRVVCVLMTSHTQIFSDFSLGFYKTYVYQPIWGELKPVLLSNLSPWKKDDKNDLKFLGLGSIIFRNFNLFCDFLRFWPTTNTLIESVFKNLLQLDRSVCPRSVCPFCQISSEFYFYEVENFLKIYIFTVILRSKA